MNLRVCLYLRWVMDRGQDYGRTLDAHTYGREKNFQMFLVYQFIRKLRVQDYWSLGQATRVVMCSFHCLGEHARVGRSAQWKIYWHCFLSMLFG